jgi:Mce-associated membrane protein
VTDSEADPATDSDLSTLLAEAEDEVSRAEARAKAARARAAQLRGDAESTSSDQAEPADPEVDADGSTSAQPRRWRLPHVRRPGLKAVAVGVGIALFCASLGATGYMVWRDRAIAHQQQLAPEFAAAARAGVIALMTLDPNHAREDIQRSIDASTGDLRAQLSARAGFMVQKAEESKVISKVTVDAVGVESVSENSGVALVSAKSDVTDPGDVKRPPMLWRIAIKLDRDNGELKMSGVDFLR